MRKPDWDRALSDYIALVHDTPYAYGQQDCLLFVAGAVKAQTGKDHAKGHRGKYSTAAGSVLHLKKLGHDTPEAMLDSLFKEKPVGFAQRGDIVLTPDGIPGVCWGDDALIVGQAGEREGLVRVPRALWTKAWAI